MKKSILLLSILFSLSFSNYAQILFEDHTIIEPPSDGAKSSLTADVDGDGDLDVITIFDQQIVWFENSDGLGTFENQQTITTNVNGAICVNTADLDGDGDLDVLSASVNDDKIAWYENEDGLGAFGDQQIITTYTDQPRYVHAGDLDGDGDMDVLSASYGDGKIAWYENLDGIGGFGGQQMITYLADEAVFVQTADIDGDEDMDVIYAAGTKLAWFENEDGLGDLGSEQLLINWYSIYSVFITDLDGDNDLDVLYASIDDTGKNPDYIISWFENADGNGAFSSNETIKTSNNRLHIDITDVDSDGDKDMLSSLYLNKIVWFENEDGLGNFGAQQIFATDVENVFDIHATDLNGDGGMDVISTSPNKITWYNNIDGSGTFEVQQNIFYPEFVDFPLSVYAADINGDGNIDVLSASNNDDKIAWYENEDGMGTFENQHQITTSAQGATSVYAADLDGDGNMDVLSASWYDNKIAWYENEDGLGTFGEQQTISTNADEVRSVYSVDLDNDGDMDVLSASSNDDKIAWYENDGLGNFGAQKIITTNADGAWSVYSADIDNDGDMDVLSASYNDDKLAWYENEDGLGNFGAQQIITTNVNGAWSVYSADIDNDGDMDVLSASYLSNKITWYENEDGLGTFGTQQIITTDVNRAKSVYTADIDVDGDLDVLSASYDDNKIAWYENEDGQGSFGAQQIITTDAIGANSVYAEDLDNDGDLDVIFSSGNDDKIRWSENLGVDTEAPTANCQNVTIALDENGLANLTGLDLDNGSTDDFGIAYYESSQNQLTCIDVGENNITLTVIDLGGNVDSCMAIITVIDNIPPIAKTKNKFVNLPGDLVIVSANQVDDGSVDNCIIAAMTLDQNTFTTIGEYTVVLSVEDSYNNVSTKNAIITVVEDNTAPEANCKDVSIILDANTMASITAIDIDSASTDNYEIATYAIDQQDFTCDHVGANNIKLTVTDIGGNTDSCTSIVTVIDNVPPVVLYQSLFLNLEGAPEITISVDDVDLGSYDNCGIAEISLSQTTFTSAGEYQIVLTVTDFGNNVSTQNTLVKIIDDLEPPIANCQDITVELNHYGLANVFPIDLDNGSTDDFSIESYEGEELTVNCLDLGIYNMMLTVVDAAGNSDSCTSIVTVVDPIVTYVKTQDITIDLAGESSMSITPDQINLGSFDNCGTITMSLDQDTFTEVGEYEVVLTVEDTNGNSKSKTAIVTVINSLVNVDDLSSFNKNLIIHPIPTTDQITIEASNNISQINIYNTQGQLLISQNTNNVSISNINLTNLAAGLYFCEVKDNEGNIGIRKVIKK